MATTSGNEVNGLGNGTFIQSDGTSGGGSASTLHFNHDWDQIGDWTEPWMTRPPAVDLRHELVQVEDVQNGTVGVDRTDGTLNAERKAVGLPPHDGNAHTENKIRRELGQPARPRY